MLHRYFKHISGINTNTCMTFFPCEKYACFGVSFHFWGKLLNLIRGVTHLPPVGRPSHWGPTRWWNDTMYKGLWTVLKVKFLVSLPSYSPHYFESPVAARHQYLQGCKFPAFVVWIPAFMKSKFQNFYLFSAHFEDFSPNSHTFSGFFLQVNLHPCPGI